VTYTEGHVAKKGTIRRVGSLVGSLGTIWLLAPLRCANPTMNQLVTLLTFWGIFIGFGIACASLQTRRWICMVSSIPFFLVAALYPLGLMVTLVGGGPMVSYHVLDSMDLGHTRVVAYSICGGATTGCAIRVVQEMSVLPGILLTKDLVAHYEGHTATVRRVSDRSVVVGIDGKTTEFAVRRLIYF
jgi:hypothetical protein